MAKSDESKRLLRAMSNVDDKYIEETLETSASSSRRAAVTGIRRYSGVIGAVAAAALVLLIGGALMGIMNRSPQTAAETAAPAAGGVNTVSDRSYSAELSNEAPLSDELDLQIDGGTSDADTEAAAPAEAVEGEEGDLLIRDASAYDSLSSVYESLNDLEEAAGYDFDAPESLEGSVSCMYINRVSEGSDNIAEILYLDEDGNTVCTIRKAPGDRNISGCEDCYSIRDRVEVDGVGTVTVMGNRRGYSVAYWTDSGYSYSVTTEDILPQETMLDLISQVG